MTVSALLRMAHKYGLKDLEDEATTRLKLAFPNTLRDFDKTYIFWERDDDFFISTQARMKLHAHDAIEAVNLAKTFDIPLILPCAFYICSTLPIETLVLGVSNPRGSRPVLSKADQIRCFQGILELSRRYMLAIETLWHEMGKDDCDYQETCQEYAKEQAEESERENDGLHSVDVLGSCLAKRCVVLQLLGGAKLCDKCISRGGGVWGGLRSGTWQDLRKIFRLE